MLTQEALDPTLAGITPVEVFLAQLLKFLVPLFMFFVMFSFLLAILLEPYILMRSKLGNAPTIWQVRAAGARALRRAPPCGTGPH